MKKLLFAMLLAGFAFGAAAQDGRAIKQRKTQKEIIEKVMNSRNETSRDQSYSQQADSIANIDVWSKMCYKYEMDWKGRVHSEIQYQEFEDFPMQATEKAVMDYETSEALPNLYGFYWQNGEWTEGWKEIYTFDENGDAVLWQQLDKQTTDSVWWNVTYYNEMTYDENHNMLTNTAYMFDMWGMSGYFTEGKEVYEYDENNFVTAMESWYFDSYEVNDWVLSSRTEYVRMPNGDYSEYTSYSYYTGEPVISDKIVKDFNEQGAIEVYHYFNNVDSKGLVETQRYTATFLEDGLTVSEYLVEDYWMNEVLESYIKAVYSYDANGNRETVDNFRWNDSLSVWEETTLMTWEYDNAVAAGEVLGHDYVWNRFGCTPMYSPLEMTIPVYNRWNRYSYETEDGATVCEAFYINWNSISENEIELENLNVRGLEGMIRYEGEAANIGVFDMAGRCVATRANVMNCDINLNAGAYVVRVGERATKVVVR